MKEYIIIESCSTMWLWEIIGEYKEWYYCKGPIACEDIKAYIPEQHQDFFRKDKYESIKSK